ncbi:MAG: hypothetical protein GWO26_31485 [Phycisphaerae bacterium]|nr:hypothetical protein [Phycisphaerae bacterium]
MSDDINPETEMGKKLATSLAYVFALENALRATTVMMRTLSKIDSESARRDEVVHKQYNTNMELLQQVDTWRKSAKLK